MKPKPTSKGTDRPHNVNCKSNLTFNDEDCNCGAYQKMTKPTSKEKKTLKGAFVRGWVDSGSFKLFQTFCEENPPFMDKMFSLCCGYYKAKGKEKENLNKLFDEFGEGFQIDQELFGIMFGKKALNQCKLERNVKCQIISEFGFETLKDINNGNDKNWTKGYTNKVNKFLGTLDEKTGL